MAEKDDHRTLRQIERVRQLRHSRLQGRLAALCRDAASLDAQKQTDLARRQMLDNDRATSGITSMLPCGDHVSGRELHMVVRRQEHLTAAIARLDEQIAATASRAMLVSRQMSDCEREISLAQRKMLRLGELLKLAFGRFRRG